MTVWYASDSTEVPEPVECDVPGYPNRDKQGRVMYLNSHFATEAEAWAHLLRSGEAGQSLSAIAYDEAKRKLEKATTQLAEDAARRCRIEDGFAEFKRRSASRAQGG